MPATAGRMSSSTALSLVPVPSGRSAASTWCRTRTARRSCGTSRSTTSWSTSSRAASRSNDTSFRLSPPTGGRDSRGQSRPRRKSRGLDPFFETSSLLTERLGSNLSGPGTEVCGITSQGHPRTAFRRALERGNLVIAEIEAREVGQLDLSEALELTALVALRDRPRGDRYALRWLARWLEETPAMTLDEAVIVKAALAALGSPGHDEALAALRGMAQRATSPGAVGRLS